ncbi:ATP-binding protein [Actinomycetes bacterium KLBMP 9797]
MPTDVRCQVESGHAHPVVRLVGSLGRDGAPAVRGALLTCLVEQPEGLVVDVSQLHVTDDDALWVFAAVAAEVAEWPATRLVFCEPPPRHVAAWRRAGVPVVPTRPDALARLGQPSGGQPVTADLEPVVGAARQARDLLTTACTRWRLSEDLTDAACIVVTELVNNVVAHARTPMTVSATRRDGGLVVAVRDRSHVEPRWQGKVAPTSQGGRGLLLIDKVARRWGATPLPDGKVVWAVLDG